MALQGFGASPASLPTDTLVFGCRHQDKDFLYQRELARLCSRDAPGSPLRCALAFSRDAPSRGKVYVQHLIRGKKAGLHMGAWEAEAEAEAGSPADLSSPRTLPSNASATVDCVWDAVRPVGAGGERNPSRVFVAGNASLPGAVFSALAHVAFSRGDFVSREAAMRYIKELERKKTIVVESWS